MVKKRQTKRQRDIKTKLMAAVCMLLVSSIMMVSTTYAWFTLSTAPEVTGITTAVGANGSLEMALLPLDGDASSITSGTSDSMAVQSPKVSNITWGNLVKLDGAGENGYGLDQIVLYPSELNKESVTVDDGTVEQITMVAPLKTPEYGADGRVAKLQANTSVGVYDGRGFYTTATEGTEIIATPYGVRGIGTVSGMSPRNLAYNLALSNANTQALQAKSTASITLNNNGSQLANVAIAHVTKEDSTFTQADVNAMDNVLTDLLNGTLVHIENALKYYIVAASIAPSTADSNYEAMSAAIMAATLTDLSDGKVTDEGGTEYTVTLPGKMTTWIEKLNTMRTDVQDAKNNLPSGKDSYTWEEISTPMNKLLNASKMTVNGYAASEVKDHISEIASAALGDGIKVTLPSGSGIFSDVADFAGDYSAEISLTNIPYGTTVMAGPFPAKMNTATTVDTVYLVAAANAVNTIGFDSGTSGGGDNPITDFYGFIIDLAFRTNAANSWLQIQQDAVDRIYADGTNTNTMGHGASMTFTISDNVNFPGDSVKRLMGAIRIVLFDPSDDNTIIGYARLNTAAADTTVANKVTMPLVMCDKAGNILVDVEGTEQNEAIAIMELNQNQIHQLSVLVYLEGSLVGNDDVPVAANMMGSMNMQFSSSATLTPMKYADLMSGDGGALNGGNNADDDDDTPVTVDVNDITDGYGATVAYGTYNGMSGICAVITETTGNTEVTSGVTVTIGSEGATYIPGAGWVVFTNTAPTGAVDIVVAPANP